MKATISTARLEFQSGNKQLLRPTGTIFLDLKVNEAYRKAQLIT